MKTEKNTEMGIVLSPLFDVSTSNTVNSRQELIDSVVKKLVSETNFQFFKGKITGNHYLIYLDEQPGTALSAGAIELGWGKKYNPKPIYQRPGDQHKLKVQKQILSDFLSGERIGTMAFYDSIEKFGNLDVVDGVQRGTIIYNFLKGKLVLDGSLASKFWAYWLKTIINGMEEPTYDEDTRRSCESLLKSINTSKRIPKVNFTNLPINLQQDIRQLSIDTKNIREVIFNCIETQEKIFPTHADFDGHKVIEMIRFKFNKLNLQQKPVDPVHLIWGSSSEYNKISRSYVETLPELMTSLGYTLEQNDAKDDKLLRVFNEIVIRSMLVYDNQINWGLGIQKFSENILDNVYENPEVSNSILFMEKFLPHNLDKVFTQTFVDVNNIERPLKLASEIVGKTQKIVMHRVFIVSLMVFYDFMMEKKLTKKYFENGEPTSNLFNLVELLSKVVSCLSLYSDSVNSSTWTTDETKVLVKYGLVGMYKENQELFDNMILLQKSGSSRYSPTQILYKVISMIDSYTL